jgi:chemotaxis protein methyltransferase CheR
MADPNEVFTSKLTPPQFKKLGEFIHSNYGIQMPDSKKVLLEGRLQKRIKINDLNNFTEYIEFLFSDNGKSKELPFFIDAVSTNKTDFYREPHHFEFLRQDFLPTFSQNNTHLKIWSAAASSGEEPYTIAIELREFMEKNVGFTYEMLGTDISTEILQRASKGIYEEKRVEIIPLHIKRKYFLKSKNREKRTVKVGPLLQKNLKYRTINLTIPLVGIPSDFDIIFCRNVLIYFNRDVQEKVINALCAKLKPGGYLLLGHSESTTGIKAPVTQVAPTIYKYTP